MQDHDLRLRAMTSRASFLCLLVASTALASPPQSAFDALRWVAGEWQGDEEAEEGGARRHGPEAKIVVLHRSGRRATAE